MDELAFPPCFGSLEDYQRWLRSDGPSPDDLSAAHCTDCLPSFKRKMLACGQCQHPETVFWFDLEKGSDPGISIVGAWRKRFKDYTADEKRAYFREHRWHK